MKIRLVVLTILLLSQTAFGSDLKVGDAAPLFQADTHDNTKFSLESRKGKWTVLYFYPKAGTPGCTKQACAFRDSIKKIRDQDADVFGVSSDTVADQAKFHKEHSLNFTLLADPDAKIISDYGTKIPMVRYSKRVTFIINPNLKIASIDRDVDPMLDAEKVGNELKTLKAAFRP